MSEIEFVVGGRGNMTQRGTGESAAMQKGDHGMVVGCGWSTSVH